MYVYTHVHLVASVYVCACLCTCQIGFYKLSLKKVFQSDCPISVPAQQHPSSPNPPSPLPVIHQPVTFSYGPIFDLFWIIYVDDGAFVLNKGLTLKELSPYSPTTSLSFASKCTLAQKKILKD